MADHEIRLQVIDLGTQSRKKVKALEKGEGELALAIRDAVERAGGDGGEAVIPVVCLFERKRKKKKRLELPLLRLF